MGRCFVDGGEFRDEDVADTEVGCGEAGSAVAWIEIYGACEIASGVDIADVIHGDAEAVICLLPAQDIRPGKDSVSIELMHEYVSKRLAREFGRADAGIEIHREGENPRRIDVI